MPPFFSIIIPLYNKENHIKETLGYVFAQTFTDFEVLIINDGSTDNSLQEVTLVEDERISIYTIKNSGVSHARNYGIKRAKSSCVALLDADDYWDSKHLENLQTLYLKFPDCGLYATAYSQRLHQKTLISAYKNVPKTPNWMGILDDYFLSSIQSSIAWTSSVMIKKEVFEHVGYFNETLTFGEDTDMWIRIALKYQVAFCNTVTATHRLDADNRISDSNPNNRVYLDLDAYNTFALTNPSLKRYLDLNRFAIALEYKLANNLERCNFYVKAIDVKNLNSKQNLLLKLPTPLLKLAFYLKNAFLNIGVNLSNY